MNILHYALGFPPYRTGGLTKFCVDLMVQQVKMGNNVALLWPGKMKIVDKCTKIKKHTNVKLMGQMVGSYEIINPLPIPYDEGIDKISRFMTDADGEGYARLLEALKPDIIHVHTLMGIHKIFLKIAKDKGIRLVFTAHDFFPICPKVTLFKNGKICDNAKTCLDCKCCNLTALSAKKMWLLQSDFYRKIKNTFIIKKIRKNHREKYLSTNNRDKNCDKLIENETECIKNYKSLRDYYYSLLVFFDCIHYNSKLTKNVYEAFFELNSNVIINITHSNIKDNRKIKIYDREFIRIRYLGPMSDGKGFYILKDALDKLWEYKKNFRLDVHFDIADKKPYMYCHERYTYKDLYSIFNETDILIAPSILIETFGFTVLEALSFGVPVIISDTVGAKDILEEGCGIVVDDITSDKLFEILKQLNSDKLKEMNKMIVNKQKIMNIKTMEMLIEKECY